MTLSPLVLSVLLICWTVPAILVLAQYWIERRSNARSTPQPVSPHVVTRQVAVEVSAHVGDPRSALRVPRDDEEWEFEAALPPLQVLEAPYAECNVHVLDGDTNTLIKRQCMMCIN